MVFVCKECGLEYADKNTAEKCENFCKKHKACDPEIAKYAIQRETRKA